MKKTFFLTIILCVIISCFGCSENKSASLPTNVKTLPPKIEDYKPIELNNIVDYHNGVYYFPHIKCDFGNVLSTWIKEHKFVKIIAITSDNSDGYGSTRGYFVVTELKGAEQ